MSKIEWTEETWSPIVGWSKAGPVWTGNLALAPEHIMTAPLRWKKPRVVFVNSMGDLFHEGVPDEWIDQVFAVMVLCPQHTFQVLTKRAERMRAWVRRYRDKSVVEGMDIGDGPITFERAFAHVWLGVSAEDQVRADERIPALLGTPAAVRFVSCEPLLGPVDLSRVCLVPQIDALGGAYVESGMPYVGEWDVDGPYPADAQRRSLNWVIVGGESGPGARPMHPDWARSIRDQCEAAGVPYFFKQWGEWRPGRPRAQIYASAGGPERKNHENSD